MKCKSVLSPHTVAEAVGMMADIERPAVPYAGGTDLMVKARTRDWYQDCALVDLHGIEELRGIHETDGVLEIGAMTTVTEILSSDLVLKKAALLADSCRQLGSPQIRNMATIGGNLANSCLAADMVPVLNVLDAEVIMQSARGERSVKASAFMKGCPACLNDPESTLAKCFFGIPAGKKNVLKKDEIITKVRVPEMGAGFRVRFQKVMRRQTGCMSRFTFAAAMKVEDQVIVDMRMSIGAAFQSIGRLDQPEKALIGTKAEADLLKELAQRLGDAIEGQQKKENPALKYKAEVCRRLLPRTLREMYEE